MSTKLRQWNRLLAVVLSIGIACSMGTVTAYAADPDSGGESAETGSAPPDTGGAENLAEPPGELLEQAEPPAEAEPKDTEPPEEPPAETEPEDTEPPDEPPDDTESEPPAEEQSEEPPVPVTLAAPTVFSQNGVTYDVSSGSAVVTGCTEDTTELVIPASVTQNGTEFPVTGIKAQAFFMNKALTRADLGGNIRTIGSRAFCGCSALTEVTGLDELTAIGEGVFLACAALESVSGLQNVTSVDTMAFMNCPALTRLDGLNLSALTAIGQQAFFNDKALPLVLDETSFSGLTALGWGAFTNMANLTGAVVLPEGFSEVPKSAFGSTGITAVSLPDSVKSIGERAFYHCTALAFVQIGQTGKQSGRLTAIGKSAFTGDTAITSFVIETGAADVTITAGSASAPTIPDTVAVTYTVESVEGTSIYADRACTLQQAVDAAADGDTITAGKSFTVEQTVTIPAGKTLTLTDGGKNLTVLPVQDFSGPLFLIEKDAALVLDGSFTYKGYRITNGVFAGVNGSLTLKSGTVTRLSASAAANCAAVDVDGGSFTMDGGTLSGIASDSAGYGAVLVRHSGTFTMNGGAISDCTFRNQYSGAVVLNGGTMTMNGGVISGNTASDSNATPGVLVGESSLFTMNGGTISENCGTRGGGVLVGLPGGVYDEATAAKFVLNNGTVSGNTASALTQDVNAGGGGVFVQDNALFTMNGGTISGNQATGTGMGGGVATANPAQDGGGRFEMNGGTISNNTASSGGGVYSCSRDTVVLRGGRIADNRAALNGGGVYVSEPPYNITIDKALVTGNTASVMGGGIWSCPTGTVILGADSAVFGNTAEKAGDDLAFLNKSEGYFSTFAGKIRGGGLVTWYKDNWVSGNQSQWGAHGAERFDASRPGNPTAPATDSIGAFSLKAFVSAEGQKQAENAAELIIEGNTAQRGGGIGTNGAVLLPGEDTPEQPISVNVRKVWSGSAAHPDTVTVHLLRINANGTQIDLGAAILSEKCTDKDGNAWAYTFENLDGSFAYTVSEDTVSGFTASITGSMADGFTVTNSKRSGGSSGGGGGGGRKPDPKPDPEPDPDPDPPIDIPDEPVPVEPLPPVEEPDEPVPQPEEPVPAAPDEDTAPSRVPQTGDIGGVWAALSALSALSLAAILRKRKI